MNGLEIAARAAEIVARVSALIAPALDLGLKIDPTLERQLRAAMDLANQALLDADKRHLAMMQKMSEKFDKGE